MIPVQVKLASALLLSLAVAGCVPTTTQTTAPVAAAPKLAGPALPAVDDPVLYASKSDANFSVPALPLEQIPAGYRRQEVAYQTTEAPGTIIIDPSKRLLYFVTGKDTAIRYGIAVGAEGFGWSGVSDVTNKRHWPRWTPPKEMIARKPALAKWEGGQPGGPTNPLGARAIYLTTNGVDYGYRIHGTPEWKSIGRNASSGCFRMINQDVMDLYERVPMGAKVVVLNHDGSYPTKLTIPPAPKPKKTLPQPKPAELLTPAAAIAPVEPGAAATPAAEAPAAGAPATNAPAADTPAVDTPLVETPAAAIEAPAVSAPAVSVPAVTPPAISVPAISAPTTPAPVVPEAVAPVAPATTSTP